MKFQKFRLNRIKYLILILLYMAFTPSVKAMVSPTNDFYINDYANIFLGKLFISLLYDLTASL